LIENPGGIRHIARVKNLNFLTLLLAFLVAGCNSSAPTPVIITPTSSEPTQAQPRLPTLKIYLGAETLDAELAVTPREEQTGMMFRTNIQETDAMLFPLPYPMPASFWMKNCPESISAAYITPDGVIQEIHHLEQNDTNAVLSARSDIQFVLETKEGWFTRHNIVPGTIITTPKGSLAEVLRRRQ
jgi:uncharacterized membrane protein (UPF0127 family)